MFNDRIVRQMTGRSIGAIICFSQSRPERPLVKPPAHEKANRIHNPVLPHARIGWNWAHHRVPHTIRISNSS